MKGVRMRDNFHRVISNVSFKVVIAQIIGSQKLTRKKMILDNTFICVVPGIGIFVLLPSALFYHVEPGWTYLDSVYYASVSITTIGLGDFVSASNLEVEAKFGSWMGLYQSFTMVWLLCGLGYAVMITEKLRKAVRKTYKKLHKAEEKPQGVSQDKPHVVRAVGVGPIRPI